MIKTGIKKTIICLLLVFLFTSIVSATEADELSESEAIEEVIDDETDSNSESETGEETEEYTDEEDIEEEETVYDGSTYYLYITSTIKDKTYPLSDEIYIQLYNYDTYETNYVKLTEENSYRATVEIGQGLYGASVYKYDTRDSVVFDNNTFTILDSDYTIKLTITGVTESEYEEEKRTSEILNGDSEVEIVENLIESNNNTEEETEVVEEIEESEEETSVAKSALSIFLSFVIDNLFVLILLFGSLIFLAVYKYRQNNNL